MNSLQRFVRPMSLLFVNALSKLAAFVLLPLLTRTLSIDAFNQWVLAQTLFGVLPLLVALGLPAAMSNRFFGHADVTEGDADIAAIGRMMALSAVIGLVSLGVVFALLARAWGLSITSAGALALSIAAATLIQIPTTHLRLHQRTSALAGVQFAEFATTLGGIGGGLALDQSIEGALVGQALAQTTLGTFSTWYLLRVLPAPSTLRFASVRATALPMVPHLLANQAQSVVDRWCLGIHAPPTELSRYAIASQLGAPVSMVTGAWNETEAPRLGERFRREGVRGLRNALKKHPFNYLLVGAGSAGLLLIGLPAIEWLLGKDFRSATGLLPAVLAIAVFDALYFPAVNALFITGQTRTIPLVTITAAIIVTLLNLGLVGSLGASGALAARALGSVARVLMLAVAAHRTTRESPNENAHGASK